MRPLLVATHNAGKLREIQAILGSDVTLKTMSGYPEIPEVVENGETFEANAIKKAVEVAEVTGMVTLADDSGLEVDALDGAPGVYSARFAGPNATDDLNNAKLLNLLADIPEAERQARFRCVIAVASPGDEPKTETGAWEGRIVNEARGGQGFGYDPLFFSPEHGKTSAELPRDTKNRASHRGKALRAAKTAILEALRD